MLWLYSKYTFDKQLTAANRWKSCFSFWIPRISRVSQFPNSKLFPGNNITIRAVKTEFIAVAVAQKGFVFQILLAKSSEGPLYSYCWQAGGLLVQGTSVRGMGQCW